MNSEFCRMISFSGGRSSAYLLHSELPLSDETIVCFANTGKEVEETLEFVRDCQFYWDVPIHWIEYCPVNKFKIVDFDTASRNGEPFASLIEKRQFTPNPFARFCTQELKVRPIKEFLKSLGIKHYDNLMGIRYDEPRRRAKLMAQNDSKKNIWHNETPLFTAKVTKADVLDFWNKQPFDLKIHSDLGNCDLCFLKGKSKIIKILSDNPTLADWWIQQENETGGTFRKDVSYEHLLYIAENQLSLQLADTPDIECFCNVD